MCKSPTPVYADEFHTWATHLQPANSDMYIYENIYIYRFKILLLVIWLSIYNKYLGFIGILAYIFYIFLTHLYNIFFPIPFSG